MQAKGFKHVYIAPAHRACRHQRWCGKAWEVEGEESKYSLRMEYNFSNSGISHLCHKPHNHYQYYFIQVQKFYNLLLEIYWNFITFENIKWNFCLSSYNCAQQYVRHRWKLKMILWNLLCPYGLRNFYMNNLRLQALGTDKSLQCFFQFPD